MVQEPALITLKDSETGMAIKAEHKEQMRGKRTCKHLIRVLETLICNHLNFVNKQHMKKSVLIYSSQNKWHMEKKKVAERSKA